MIELGEEFDQLYTAINQLKKDYRDVIILRKIKEFEEKFLYLEQVITQDGSGAGIMFHFTDGTFSPSFHLDKFTNVWKVNWMPTQ